MNNLNKLKVLVEELTIKDSEIFEAKELLEIILETATDGYWDWNIVTGYEYMSLTFKAQLGYTEDEMENKPESWQAIIYKEDLNVMFAEVDKHFKSKGEYQFSVKSRYTHKDGSEVKILCRGKVIEWGDNGEPLRMVGTHIDLTNL